MDLRFWKRMGALATFAACALIGAAAPNADAKKPLVVKRFLLGRLEPNTGKFIATGARGTTNAMRDNVIMFVFTANVDLKSVNARTVRIGIPATSGLFIDAPGSFYYYEVKRFDSVANDFVTQKLYKNRILFDPTSRYEPVLQQDPYGFAENATYSVIVPGLDADTVKVVRGTNGSYNLRTFATSFGTADRYLQDYRQPAIVKVEGSDLPGYPLELRSNVDSRADVVVTFSEPMLPAAFTEDSFNVYNLTTDKLVRGSFRASSDGLSFSFRPAIGYGRGPSDIEVTITTDLLDRSQNPLNRGVTFRFQSELDLSAPSYNEVIERFDNQAYYDGTFSLSNVENGRAVWGYPAPPAPGVPTGLLYGAFGAGTKEVNFGFSGSFGSPPLWLYGSHAQMLYTNAQLSTTARTLTGYSLLLDSGQSVAVGTYQGTSVVMGHNNTLTLNTNFTGSFSDTPVTTVNNIAYIVTVASYSGGWVKGPTFTTNWAYNGIDNAVLDVNVTGTAGPYMRCARGNTGNAGIDYHFVAGGGGGTSSFVGQNLSARFFYLVDTCEAQSKWYDTTTIDPTAYNPSFLEPIVIDDLPAGTSIGLTFQGGREDPGNPGQVDNASLSSWTGDPRSVLLGYRFIRFHADMTNNISASTVPKIDQIIMPFIWY
jgi:hypothetical protein